MPREQEEDATTSVKEEGLKVARAIAEFYGAMSLNAAVPTVPAVLGSEPAQQIPLGVSACGQSEPLTTRLRNILKDYTEVALFREMIQNADDAGATKLKVVLLTPKVGGNKFLTREMQDLQGPSLNFWNDASFKSEDWEGVQSLGTGAKRMREGKIGRHGLGFNAAYNITDIPVVVSGSGALFLDPHVRYLKGLADAARPGARISLDKVDVMRFYPDQFAPLSSIAELCTEDPTAFKEGRDFPGSVIHMPLRTKETAALSEICKSCLDWEQFVCAEQEGGHKNRLFLRNIETVELWEHNEGEGGPPVLRARRRIAVERHSSLSPSISLLTQYYDDPKKSECEFHILEEGEVSVAVPVQATRDTQGSICCRLPVGDLQTGTPVSVSANFVSSSDRRSLVLDDHSAAASNEASLQEVARVWTLYLEHRAAFDRETPLRLFPVTSHTSVPYLKKLATYFYSNAPSHPRMHCDLAGEPLETFDFLVRPLEEVRTSGGPNPLDPLWTSLGIPVVPLGLGVWDEYRGLGCQQESPETIRGRLQGNRERSWPLSREDTWTVLEYCLSDGGDVGGCNLCPLFGCDSVVALPTAGGAPQPIIALKTKAERVLLESFVDVGSARVADVPVETASKLHEAKTLSTLDYDTVARLFLLQGDITTVQKQALWGWLAEATQEGSLGTEGIDVLGPLVVLPVEGAGGGGGEVIEFSNRRSTFYEIGKLGSELVEILAACGVFVLASSDVPRHICERLFLQYSPDSFAEALGRRRIVEPDLVTAPAKEWLRVRRMLEDAGEPILREHAESLKSLPLFMKFPGSEMTSSSVGHDTKLLPPDIHEQLVNTIAETGLDFKMLVREETCLTRCFEVPSASVEEVLLNCLIPNKCAIDPACYSRVLKEIIPTLDDGCDDRALRALAAEAFVPTRGGYRTPSEALLLLDERKFTGLSNLLECTMCEEWAAEERLVAPLKTLGLRDVVNEDELRLLFSRVEDRETALMLGRYLERHPVGFEGLEEVRGCRWLPRDGSPDLCSMAGEGNVTRYSEESARLVGQVAPILHRDLPESVLDMLEVPLQPAEDDMVRNLQTLPSGLEACPDQWKEAVETCELIYKHLEAEPEFPEDFKWVCLELPSGFKLVTRNEVFKSQHTDAEPYLWSIPRSWSNMKVFEGLAEQPSVEDLLRVLHAINEKAAGDSLDADKKDVCVKVIGQLRCSVSKGGGGLDGALLLDTNGYLRPASKVVVNNMAWLKTDPKLDDADQSLLHEDIPFATALFLGAQNLGSMMVAEGKQQVWGSDDGMCVMGQQEPLTVRLKNTVKDYQIASLPLEFAQNAEDAGAKSMHMIFDRRSHGTKSLLSRGMHSWQGPALCFYNDALFSSKDWRAITRLGVGGKRGEEDVKIGRHGLGFNACYNLTDQPTILSGQAILFLDPHVKHLEDVGATPDKPGIKLEMDKRDFPEMWPDQFRPYKSLGYSFGEDRHFDGTLIRLPVRSEEKADESDIRDYVFGETQWRSMVEKHVSEGHLILLFLRSLNELVVSEVTRDGDNRTLVELVRSSSDNADGTQCVTIRTTTHSEGDGEVVTPRRYLMCHVGGATVAVLCDAAGEDADEKGRFFARLPLPIETQSQAHIDALFWTSSDRRTIFAVQDGYGGDKEKWSKINKSYLDNAVDALLELITVRASQTGTTPTHLFPHTGDSAEHVQYFSKAFYNKVLDHPGIFYTCCGKKLEAWPPITKLESCTKKEQEVFQRIGCSVVTVLPFMQEALEECCHEAPPRLSGSVIRSWLRDKKVAPCREDAAWLLSTFTRSSDDVEDLAGCMLCHLYDGTVQAFSEDNVVIFPQQVEEQVVLPLNSGKVMRCLKEVEYLLKDSKFVRQLEVEDIPSILDEDGGFEVTEDWARILWTWLDTKTPIKRASNQSHCLDDLSVLPVDDGNGDLNFEPLHQRVRSYLLPEEDGTLSEVLRWTGVKMVPRIQGIEKFVDGDSPSDAVRAVVESVKAHGAPSEGKHARDLLDLLVQASRAENRHYTLYLCQQTAMLRVCGSTALRKLPENALLMSSEIEAELREQLVELDLPGVLNEGGDIAVMLDRSKIAKYERTEELLRTVFKKIEAKEIPVQKVSDLMRTVLNLEHTLDLVKKDVSQLEFVTSVAGSLVSPTTCLETSVMENKFPYLRDELSGVLVKEAALEGLLKKVGLRTQLAPDEILTAAENIEKAQSPVKAAHVLVDYLKRRSVGACTPNDLADNLNAMFRKLQSIKYIPVKEKPCDWEGPWLGSTFGTFVAPAETEVWNHDDLGCVRVVGDFGCLHDDVFLKRFLNVRVSANITDAVLVESINAFSAHGSARAEVIQRHYIRLTCERNYDTIGELKRSGKWIWSDKLRQFMESWQVTRDGMADSLEPFVTQLPLDMSGYPVFRHIEAKLSVGNYLAVLEGLALRPSKCSEEMQNNIWLKCLEAVESFPDLPELDCERLVAPDVEGVLRPVDQLYFKDITADERPEGRHSLHNIAIPYSNLLKVVKLSTLCINEMTLPLLEECENKNYHTTRANRSNEIENDAIFSEHVRRWVQYCEDAEATDVRVILEMGVNHAESRRLEKHAYNTSLYLHSDSVITDWLPLLRFDEEWRWLLHGSCHASVCSGDTICYLNMCCKDAKKREWPVTVLKNDPRIPRYWSGEASSVCQQGTCIRLDYFVNDNLAAMQFTSFKLRDECLLDIKEYEDRVVFLSNVRYLKIAASKNGEPVSLFPNAEYKVKVEDNGLTQKHTVNGTEWVVARQENTQVAFCGSKRLTGQKVFPDKVQEFQTVLPGCAVFGSLNGSHIALCWARILVSQVPSVTERDIGIFTKLALSYKKKNCSLPFDAAVAATYIREELLGSRFAQVSGSVGPPTTSETITQTTPNSRHAPTPNSRHAPTPKKPLRLEYTDLSSSARKWLYNKAQLVVVPESLAAVFKLFPFLTKPHWDGVHNEFIETAFTDPALYTELFEWIFLALPDYDLTQCPVLCKKGFMHRSEPIWHCSSGTESIVLAKDRILNSIDFLSVVKTQLSDVPKRTGLCDPRNPNHVVSHLQDIDAREFWKHFSERNPYNWIENKIEVLENKIEVRVCRYTADNTSKVKTVLFGKHCALLAPKEPAPWREPLQSLRRMGCWFSCDPMPGSAEASHVGDSREFVAAFLQKHINQLDVSALGVGGLRALLAFVGGKLASSYLQDVKLVVVNHKEYTLRECTFLRSFGSSRKKVIKTVGFAAILRNNFPVFALCEEGFDELEKEPHLSIMSCTETLLKFTLDECLPKEHVIEMLELIATEDLTAHMKDLALVRVGEKRLRDYWDVTDPLVQILMSGQDSSIPAVYSKCMKSCRSFEGLQSLLQPNLSKLRGSVDHEAYQSAFFKTINTLPDAEVERCRSLRGDIFPHNGTCHAVDDVYSAV